ncbi:MAG: HAD domain-containing protein [Coprococcus sp.]
MKVIFFDVEGVLNSNKFVCNGTGEHIDRKNVANLKAIVKATDAKLVLTSDWRAAIYKDADTKPQIKELLDKLNEAGLEIYGITPGASEIKEKYDDYGRVFEVKSYIKNNNVENFVIIDDMDMDWERENLEEYWINTENVTHGLTEEDARKAIELLNK